MSTIIDPFLVFLPRGVWVLGDRRTGYAKTYANRTQAYKAASGVPGAYVVRWSRPFLVVVPR